MRKGKHLHHKCRAILVKYIEKVTCIRSSARSVLCSGRTTLPTVRPGLSVFTQRVASSREVSKSGRRILALRGKESV